MPKFPFATGARVNTYIRDSGGEKQELSLDQQAAAIRAWCAENGLILVHVFQDSARKGSSIVGRDGFQDMMHRFRSPDCQETGLVIWNYQRFARDVDDAQFFRADLRRRGFIFHSLNDEIPEGPMGRLFEAAIDWKNEQFLEDLSRDVKRGLSELVLKYGAVPGTPPRGFKRVPISIGQRRDKSEHIAHRWEPDPEIAPLVQQAFEMKAVGRSLVEITAATGLFKSANSYTSFFRNEIYIGILNFGGLVIENYCDPLIDQATWQAVQARLKSTKARQHLTGDNPQHPRRRSAWLLSGLAYCGACGSPLYGLSALQRNGSYYDRYHCTRAKRNHDCDAQAIPRRFLDQAVIGGLHDQILTPENILARHTEDRKSATENRRKIKVQLTAQQKRLAETRRQLTNVTSAIAERSHSRALLDKLGQLEAEEADCLAQISRLNLSLETPNTVKTRAQITSQVNRLRAELETGDPERVMAVLRGLVSRVTVLRKGNMVHGLLEYHGIGDLKKAKAPYKGAATVSICPPPMGAPTYRHSFSACLKRKRA